MRVESDTQKSDSLANFILKYLVTLLLINVNKQLKVGKCRNEQLFMCIRHGNIVCEISGNSAAHKCKFCKQTAESR